MSASTLLLFEIILVILICLVFHINIPMCFPNFTKILSSIWNTDILKLFSLPTHECTEFLHLSYLIYIFVVV